MRGMDESVLRGALGSTLEQTHFESLGEFYEGKVRDNYSRDGKRIIITTDRISAFDRVLGTIPFKGQILTRLAAHWFETLAPVA
jgi:phosphoribosylaminoimidazole-succinocarboxamide synthase